jgi:hypothetical protein
MFIELTNPNSTPCSVDPSLIKFVSVATVNTPEGSREGSQIFVLGVGNLYVLTSYSDVMKLLSKQKPPKIANSKVLKMARPTDGI